MAMAAWALAAYGARASYGDDSGVVAAYDGDSSAAWGSYASYGSVHCSDEAAAAECKYCDAYGMMTDLRCDEIANDGTCDYACNTAGCSWDGMDCFHDDNGCYVEADGNDYRGTVSVTVEGKECAVWSDPKLDAAYVRAFGASPTWRPENYPDAGLGGHNYCRNPDHGVGKCEEGKRCSKPWCLYWKDGRNDEKGRKRLSRLGWAYCDVGAPSASCPGKPSYAPAVPEPLSWSGKSGASQSAHAQGHVKEHKYNYYSLHVPAELKGLLIVLVPTSSGPYSPRLFADFDVRNPTGHNASYHVTSSSGGVSELRLMRTHSGFCGNSALGVLADCTLFLGVVGRTVLSDYSLLVYDMERPAENVCAASCDWSSLGDGACDTQCNNAACFFDRADCDLGKNTGCPYDCSPNYIGDGLRDYACFTLKCGWDGGDFGATEGCADYCLASMANNGVCDPQCNVASCDFDGADCFHRHSECYRRPNGYDYRGTVSHTISGKQCQRWSDQTPHAHGHTVHVWPSAGLGGHNFCRNPDQSEPRPWCYVAEPQLDENGVPIGVDWGIAPPNALGNRFQLCDVGRVSEEGCIMSPPPPPPPGRPVSEPISPVGLAALVAGSALGVCALVVLALRNRRSSLALARMQLELVKARAQSAKLAERDDVPGEMSQGEMRGGSARAMRHDGNSSRVCHLRATNRAGEHQNLQEGH